MKNGPFQSLLKGSLQTILTVVLGFVAQQYYPFWAMAVVAGVVALFFKYGSSHVSFMAGFAAAFLLWNAYAYTLDLENMNLLSGKLASLFKSSDAQLKYATGFIGGVLGGFGAMTGSLFRKIFL